MNRDALLINLITYKGYDMPNRGLWESILEGDLVGSSRLPIYLSGRIFKT